DESALGRNLYLLRNGFPGAGSAFSAPRRGTSGQSHQRRLVRHLIGPSPALPDGDSSGGRESALSGPCGEHGNQRHRGSPGEDPLPHRAPGEEGSDRDRPGRSGTNRLHPCRRCLCNSVCYTHNSRSGSGFHGDAALLEGGGSWLLATWCWRIWRDGLRSFRPECQICGGIFEPEKKAAEMKELEEKAGSADFWQDQAAAQRALQRRTRLGEEIEEGKKLISRMEDAR